MSTVDKNHYPVKKIDVIINGDEENGFTFTYESEGKSCECFIANGPCRLEYTIQDSAAQRDYGFAFDGVAFNNPFNNVITEANIINNGQTIVLTNPFDVSSPIPGKCQVGFQFGFSFQKTPSGCKAKNLLLLSADPQVINEHNTTLPGGH